jgi:hypothetical protein
MPASTATVAYDDVVRLRADLEREHTFHVSLAYILAFASALGAHIERLLGRSEFEYDDFKDLISPQDPVLEELWRAKTTSERARELVCDTELLRKAARDIPQLAAMAKDHSERLLASVWK